MLTAQLGRNENIIELKNSYIYKDRIKEIPSAAFDERKKVWTIARKHINYFEQKFHGEVYYKTPLWMIKGEPAPDYSKLYELEEDITLPETRIPLYNYQTYGTKFLINKIKKHSFAINADGVGLGKTPSAIAVMMYMSKQNNCNKILLIVKKSIKYQWMHEIAKFSTLNENYTVICTEEVKKKRDKNYEQAMNENKVILITNYHNFLNDTEKIKQIGFDFAVIDEAHCIKARTGTMNRNISTITQHIPVLFLTGTPVMSRPEDIFGIVQMANPDYFGDWDEFKKKHLVQRNQYGYTATVGVKNLDELHNKVQDIVIRRTEYEVAVQMPETIKHDVYVETSEEQKELLEIIQMDGNALAETYKKLEERKKCGFLPEEDLEKMNKTADKLKGMIAIRQIAATDPKMFISQTSKMIKSYEKMLPSKLDISPKTNAIIELVEDILSAEEKVILFSKYVTVGLYYKEIFESKLKEKVLMYTGREDSKKRDENVRLFCDTDEYNILIGTDAMAEGLNLAEARHVINIDLPDTFAIYTQRTGRVRRVSSQYKNIIVHNMITKMSVDERRLEKLIADKNLDGALVDASKEQRKALIVAMNETERK